MNTHTRRERERQELRTRILDAARELFASHGYDAVTMRKVAEKVEYSPTAIYLHFPDKESLLRELCDVDFRRFGEELIRIARVKDPIERLRQAGLAYIEFALANPNHYRLMFMTPHPPMSPEASSIAAGDPTEDAYAFVRGIVADAIAQQRLRPELRDAELVAQIMWAGVHGVAAIELTMAGNPWIAFRPIKKRAKAMIDTLLRGITR
ncbi:MAG TPA: TetR/AcrR family transcriptional regulator [Thermoanaerobaculia bacterium]